MFKIADRVKEQTTGTGTGDLTLSGAVVGFKSFSAEIGADNSCYYCIVSQSANEWEVGIGTYKTGSSRIQRDAVLKSTNSDALVNFSAGVKEVFVNAPASGYLSNKFEPVPKTAANYILLDSDHGRMITNKAAAGTVKITVPNNLKVDGFECTLAVHTAQPLQIEPDTTAGNEVVIYLADIESIDGALTEKWECSIPYSLMKIKAFDRDAAKGDKLTIFVVESIIGTWNKV